MKGLTVTIGVIILAQIRNLATALPLSDFDTYDQSTESQLWSSRSLLQQGICPETEYYCGPGDAFEKEVHNALNQPSNCSFDQGNLYVPPEIPRKDLSRELRSRQKWADSDTRRYPAVVLRRLCHH